jgi:hypothetical protein
MLKKRKNKKANQSKQAKNNNEQKQKENPTLIQGKRELTQKQIVKPVVPE